MFARMTTLQGSAPKVADGIRAVQEQVIPSAQKIPRVEHQVSSVEVKAGTSKAPPGLMKGIGPFPTHKEAEAAEKSVRCRPHASAGTAHNQVHA